ncbi:MAG: type I glyceraldehyde-3-phosphate dehydrogenase [Saprospiraceae bacterium]|nr:type I glyceraldehyde-3-phosphate dehydrogenase [Saprospiraceae bacterium]
MKRIAINGFGRIGRLTYRFLSSRPEIEVVAINDLTDIPTLAHLLEFDTAQRRFQKNVGFNEKAILVDGKELLTFNQKDPRNLPWKELQIDLVLECTGIYLTREAASMHIDAGAKKVILSAPPKDSDIPTFVTTVNDGVLPGGEFVISNASCTTNCLAVVLKAIHENFGIEFASMNTIHAFTQDQRLQDAPHKDLRRARAASMNIIPTSTGAGSAVEAVYPAIKGKLMASSYRVPIITGSLIELVCKLQKPADADAVNQMFREEANNRLKGILEYSEKPLVSTDIIGNTHSAIFDAPLTNYKDGYLKVVAWYDNEAGYSARLADLCIKFAHH